MIYDVTKFALGKLCRSGHDWEGEGCSLRYLSNKRCVRCQALRAKRHYDKHANRIQEKVAKCKAANPDGVRESNKRSYQKNKAKRREANKAWKTANPERVLAIDAAYRDRNKDSLRVKAREHNHSDTGRAAKKRYKERNKGKLRVYERERWHSDAQYRLSKNVAVRMRLSLRAGKNNRTWRSLVGYGVEELARHLEARFVDGMTWENYGSYWHIDHIRPLATFEYEVPDDPGFKDAWSLANLRPLHWRQNVRENFRGIRFEPTETNR